MKQSTLKRRAIRSKRSKATDIPRDVKLTVWARDNGRCIICGNAYNTMPNSHFIPRSKGGLGVEENIGTMCTELTPNKCHRKYDFGTREEREEIGRKFEEYLKSKYPKWDKDKLYYKKWSDRRD